MARDFDVVSPRGRLFRGALSVWAVLIYLFLFAPIVLLVVFSFNANQYGTFPIVLETMREVLRDVRSGGFAEQLKAELAAG